MSSSSTPSPSVTLAFHIREHVLLIFKETDRVGWHLPKKIHKYLSLSLACLGFFSFMPHSSYADEEKYFIVTAYYSPLPGQSFYFRGNYEAEVALNGNGTHGASGKSVFQGMIAAPKTYAFGTKINFEGLGVGIVEDRGGAIVSSGNKGNEYDRIDIWMGTGEEGLKRALLWGKRVVKGTIGQDGANISFASIDTGKVQLGQFENVNASSSSTLPAGVMQMFADLGYTPENGNIQKMVLSFQLDHKVIANASEAGAGNYGPKTTAKLQSEHSRYKTLLNSEIQKIELEKNELISESIKWTSNYEEVQTQVMSFGSPRPGETGEHVRNLQKNLKKTGYMKAKDTGVMTPLTVLAIKSLQKDSGLPRSGTIDTATQVALVEALMNTTK